MPTKKMSRASFLALLALLLASSDAVTAQVTADSIAVLERLEAYQEIWNGHDASALAAFFTEDADMIHGNGSITRGRLAIQEWWRNYFAQQEPERRASFAVTSLRHITDDVCLINLASTTGGRDDHGQELLARQARGTLVLVRRKGEWFISAMRGMPTERDRVIRASDKDQLEANKEIVRRVLKEGVNAHNLEFFREMLTPDYARHSQATTEMQEIRGVEGMLEFLKANFTAFPDWHETIELMIAEGDKVAYITTGTGTHTGPMGDIPPTGEKMEITNYIIQRIENGKIAETWIGWDNLAALVQLGLFPPSAAATKRPRK